MLHIITKRPATQNVPPLARFPVRISSKNAPVRSRSIPTRSCISFRMLDISVRRAPRPLAWTINPVPPLRLRPLRVQHGSQLRLPRLLYALRRKIRRNCDEFFVPRAASDEFIRRNLWRALHGSCRQASVGGVSADSLVSSIAIFLLL